MSARRAAEHHGGSPGMSLAELMVALAVLSIVLAVATAMLLSLLRQSASLAGREPTVGRSVDLALDHVAHDVREAVSLPLRVGEHEAGDQTLIVERSSGDVVVYALDGSRFVRIDDAAGDEPQSSVLVEDIVAGGFDTVSTRLRLVVLHRRGEPTRQRAVLARNVDR